MKIFTESEITNIIKKHKYVVFTENKPNIVGVRSLDKTTNLFNDICYVFYKEGTKNFFNWYTITTEPGEPYLKKLINPKGTAILVPGQYVGCWIMGRHNGNQDALVQQGGPVKVYRDKNKDNKWDLDDKTIDSGYFGINLHHAGPILNKYIGPHSAGCQVWKYKDAHQELIQRLTALSLRHKFSKFTYTLLKEEDFLLDPTI